jgi:ribulose-phosphate 3-epimerase
MESSYERIRTLKKAIDDAGADTIISVVGGVTLGNIKSIYDAGARLFVACSTVFHAEDPGKACDELKKCCM